MFGLAGVKSSAWLSPARDCSFAPTNVHPTHFPDGAVSVSLALHEQ